MNKKTVLRLASIILKEALAMRVDEPTRVQSRTILKALRDHFGIEAVQRPIWRQYITYIDPPTNNKYHYFVVFQDGDRYTAANAYGRIGYQPRIKELYDGDDKNQAINLVKNKMRSKLSKGYEITPL